MRLRPDLSGFGIQIGPIYRDPRAVPSIPMKSELAGLSSIFVDFVG